MTPELQRWLGAGAVAAAALYVAWRALRAWRAARAAVRTPGCGPGCGCR